MKLTKYIIMVDVIDNKISSLYIDALSSSLFRKGRSSFESKRYAELYIRRHIEM